MNTEAYSWGHCGEADDNEMSACIDMWKCTDSPFVAYYISNKLDIMGNYDYSDVYKPLENNFGIYFLMGRDADGNKTVYIGQASERDSSKGMARLQEHVNPSTREKYYDDWQSAVFITSRSNDWHSGLLNDIEKYLINKYRASGKYRVLNSKNGDKGNSEKRDLARKVLAILALVSKPKFGYSLGNVEIQFEEDKLEQLGLVAIKIEELESYKQAQKELDELKSNRNEEQIRLDKYKIYADWEEKFNKIDIPIYNGRIDEIGKEPRYQDVVTPQLTASDMVKMIPAELFNSKTTFIDIYTKSASILLEIIKRLMSDNDSLPINNEPEFQDKIARINNIIENQIFGIAGTEKGYINSIKVIKDYIEEVYKEVYGEKDYRTFKYCNVILPSIFRINNYATGVKVDKAYIMKEISLKISGGTEENMRFDVVVGNPPYNDDKYIPFVEMGDTLAKECSIWITPAKWQNTDKKIDAKFRKNISKNIKEIHYYPDCLDIFGISELSGICYYLLVKNNKELCTVYNSSKLQPIINSCETRSIVEEETLWNCGNSIVNKLKNYAKYSMNDISNRMLYTVNINKQIMNSLASGAWDWNNSKIKSEYIGKGGCLFTPKGECRILGRINIITSDFDSSSGTSIDVFTSNDINECNSFISWINTKLFRFLILINIGSLTMMHQRGWRFVPDPGVFDHVFTDEELYEKYNLTEEEINIIESVIKSRDTNKPEKLQLGIKVNTGTKELWFWIGSIVSDETVAQLQGILETAKDENGKNIIKSIHLDTKKFDRCTFEILVSNRQSNWHLNPDMNNGFNVSKSFSVYTETVENGYPLLNSYKEEIFKRVKYTDGIIDVDKAISLTQQDLMANYINKMID